MTDPTPQPGVMMVSVGTGNPHRTIRLLEIATGLSAVTALAMMAALIITKDIGWYKAITGFLLLALALSYHIHKTWQRHHDEMEAALTLFANLATQAMRENARYRGTDPDLAWQELTDQLNAVKAEKQDPE